MATSNALGRSTGPGLGVSPIASAPGILTWRAFPLVGIPVAALLVALQEQGVFLDYVHVLSGALWTGIDIFMGLVIGPIMARMPPASRAQFVQNLVPTMLFLMPTLASVTITAGIYLAVSVGVFNLHYLAIQLAGLIVVVLLIQGLGIFLPNEIRVVLELRKERPDVRRIGRWGLINARLSGVQAIFQVALIFVMACLAAGLVNL
jgi:hypothetical protein